MIWSVMALISFRSEPAPSGITFALGIINTFISPTLIISPNFPFVLAFHILLLISAIVWRVIKGAPDLGAG